MSLKLTAAALALAFVAPAYAQESPPCALRADLVAKLGEKYGETLLGRGLMPDGRLFELFASEETGTWTVLTTEPGDLMACFAAAGQMWDAGPAAPAKGDPA